jgi:hypothetical protein
MTGVAYFLLGVMVTMFAYGVLCWWLYKHDAMADDDTESGVK